MQKYKITKSGEGFSIWILKDFGGGMAWISCGKLYGTKYEAELAAAEVVHQITQNKGGV